MLLLQDFSNIFLFNVFLYLLLNFLPIHRLKNQTQGELDDTRLIEGITGEKTIYKKRGDADPEPGKFESPKY